MNEQYDVAITGGSVCCFVTNSLIKCNIGIKDGKIARITNENIFADQQIDVPGKIVAPGFIDFHSHVDGKSFSGKCMVRQGATTTIGGERNFDGKQMRRIYEQGFIINQGYYVSHSFTLRKAVNIVDPYEGANLREIEVMVSLAEEFLKNGAYGIHFGLEFVPGTTKEEIYSLAEVAKKYNKPIIIHSRKDGKEALESLYEIINIANETKAAVHILHMEYMVGYNGTMDKALKLLRNAVSQGTDISADTGLYDAFPSCIGSSILDNGWMYKYREGTTYNNLIISSGVNTGKECTEEEFYYMQEHFPSTLVTAFVLDEEPIAAALKEGFMYVSTNAADGPHYEGIGHPESAGTFPRLIGKYVREDKTLELIEAIKKVTYLPAKRFGINNKGNIKEGYDADLVIFDFDRIKDRANYVNLGDPNKPPEGISYVIVNGKVVVKENEITEHDSEGRMLIST